MPLGDVTLGYREQTQFNRSRDAIVQLQQRFKHRRRREHEAALKIQKFLKKVLKHG